MVSNLRGDFGKAHARRFIAPTSRHLGKRAEVQRSFSLEREVKDSHL
jgi:hypothetical protein